MRGKYLNIYLKKAHLKGIIIIIIKKTAQGFKFSVVDCPWLFDEISKERILYIASIQI